MISVDGSGVRDRVKILKAGEKRCYWNHIAPTFAWLLRLPVDASVIENNHY
jgi:hypothetical protein